ncbi:MAG: nucleotidyltransferase domain-containing protein [Proteobacteria bacterium]|nr:nucleotidyltransferase domain-containing protein [Desulfobacteraceae bacterium]MBU2521457.1 nucleotidyltransferase domain-containing protein [Pseudomonadota bacterium]MBU3980618.1 nucleotidyltransferase domain-containing protein [Pseudomonadota bacterium]MBU4012497.1 nucleotidyltransferase domain-containing protein [Pseudomonadota bacterium]MBU4068369.1 nucleotidyltransferase domain-containing protein [Pseudomonadota bacterium]
MVRRKIGLEKILAQFITETKKRIPVQKIILFGSYAKGTPKKWSDIDIAVISPKFADMDDLERIRLLLDCAHRIKCEPPVDIETFGYTPEEYENAGYFEFLGVIKKTGKVIYEN